jgi:NitT/TauT family transport system substrate-binding protein
MADMNRRDIMRYMAAGGLVLGSSGLLAACSTSSGSGTKASGQSFDLIISAYPSELRNLPWIIAKDQNYWQKSGLNVTYVASNGGGTTLRAMELGSVPLSDGAPNSAISAFYSGSAIQILGAMSTFTQGFVQRPDESINTIADLKGKTMGYTSTGSVTQLVNLMLIKQAGLVGDVQNVALGSVDNGLPALLRGEVDIVLGDFPSTGAALKAGQVKASFTIQEVLPGFLSTVMIGSQLVVKDNPALIQEIVNIRQKAADWAANNPDAALKLYQEASGADTVSAEYDYNSSKPFDEFFSPKLSIKGLQQLQLGMSVAGQEPTDSTGNPIPIQWSQIVNQNFLSPSDRTNIPTSIPLP